MMFDEEAVRKALEKSWSINSARQWTEERPFEGQCNVTAAVMANIFGGEILSTPWNDVTAHYYNRIDGQVYDLTDAQFDQPIFYADDKSSQEIASQGFTRSEFESLKSAFLANLGDLL